MICAVHFIQLCHKSQARGKSISKTLSFSKKFVQNSNIGGGRQIVEASGFGKKNNTVIMPENRPVLLESKKIMI